MMHVRKKSEQLLRVTIALQFSNLLTSFDNELTIHVAGAPCNNFRGYCDVFQKCRDVDADGPLARLKKLLFNEETFNEIRDWIIVSYGYIFSPSNRSCYIFSAVDKGNSQSKVNAIETFLL